VQLLLGIQDNRHGYLVAINMLVLGIHVNVVGGDDDDVSARRAVPLRVTRNPRVQW
jgi:hypothetical protein